MALFQVSVLNTYLKLQEEQKLAIAFKKFSKYFHNPTIQENIRNSKEEQFQATFLNELFVKVLGYTLNPQPDFNLSTEFKNENNARKADGAILKDGAAIGVIELKGTNTKDLEGIRRQAFDYKVNQKSCVYVITSNFEKLRFYINDATEFIEFDLFLLTAKDFALLYLCLQKENILKNLPLKIKESSVVKEEQITKEFYKDYSVFKRELYRDLVRLNSKTLKKIRLSDPNFSGVQESNPDYAKSQAQLLRLEKNVKLELFKKSQKLIDRFLFIFFAEDRGLLPPNSTIRIVKDWNKLKELDAVVPLYNRFKLYFSYLDQGRKSTDTRAEIFAYNGGLFKPDNLLDRLEINDELLAKHTTQLSKYNFESQVDVNILGHIFENSLNEIESVSAEIEGADFDKQKSKRKKDGVFYTPKYITKYIVENTLGKLCEEKKSELGFREEEYYKGRKRRQKDTLEGLIKILDDYRNWLLQLTICDPACGSGAFLNQALDFLIKEHRYIDEMKAKLLGGGLVFSDIETTILEKNIYGVDINEESIEIAKLSLWLRTAQPKRKLNDLSSNIKCGNSLIDDKKVAGDKAFKWEEEFKDIFAKGGFDVVIGNPPYVNINTLPKDVNNYLASEYKIIHTGYNDLMYYFLYKGIDLLNEKGVNGLITSNYFIGNEYAKLLRAFLSNYISEIINFEDYQIFSDAHVHTVILFSQKNQKQSILKYRDLINKNISLVGLEPSLFRTINKNRKDLKEYWLFAENNEQDIITKLNTGKKFLGKISNIEKGSTSGKNEVFTISEEIVRQYNFEKDLLRKNVKNGDILRYNIFDRGTYLIYTDNETDIKNYPNILGYLKEHQNTLSNRNEVKKGSYPWWRLERPRKKEIYDAEEKLIVPYRAKENRFAYDNQQRFNDGGDVRVIVLTNSNFRIKYVLALLNSNLLNWYFGFIGKPKGNSREYFNEPLSKLPIVQAEIEVQNEIIGLVEIIMEKEIELKNIIERFTHYLLTGLSENIIKKLQNWHQLDFSEFIKEINKAIKKEKGEPLSKKDEFEWMELFEENKKKAQELQRQIKKTDVEIDRMVYELYGLTEEEITIVESS